MRNLITLQNFLFPILFATSALLWYLTDSVHARNIENNIVVVIFGGVALLITFVTSFGWRWLPSSPFLSVSFMYMSVLLAIFIYMKMGSWLMVEVDYASPTVRQLSVLYFRSFILWTGFASVAIIHLQNKNISNNLARLLLYFALIGSIIGLGTTIFFVSW